MSDVLVVGGGVIGLSIAYELSGQGVTVKVLEAGSFGREASWAGAGILPPGNPDRAEHPYDRLRAESCRLWPEWSSRLREETGVDNGFRNSGGIEVRLGGPIDALDDLAEAWEQEGVQVERLTPAELFEHEPALNPRMTCGLRVPQKCQVRNPRHLKALLASLAARGVELVSGSPVVDWDLEHGRVVAARTLDQSHAAGMFVVAAGAWSRKLIADCGTDVSVEPVRGQIVMLASNPPPFGHVIGLGARYLVPRPDGRILVGSTEEWVGYDKSNTAGGVAGLIQFAEELVPCLAGATFEKSWAGLRPGSADGLPFLGPVPGIENLLVATGHFRSGLQLSPATAVVISQLVLDQKPLVPLELFAVDRGVTDRVLRPD